MTIHRGPWGPAFLKQPTGGGGGPLPLLWSFENEPGVVPITVNAGDASLPVEDNNGGTYNGNNFFAGSTLITNDPPSPAGGRNLRTQDGGAMLDMYLSLGGNGPLPPIPLPVLSTLTLDFYMKVRNVDGTPVGSGWAGVGLGSTFAPFLNIHPDATNTNASFLSVIDNTIPVNITNVTPGWAAFWNTTVGTTNPGEWADTNWHHFVINLTTTTIQITYDGTPSPVYSSLTNPDLLTGVSIAVNPFYNLGAGPYYVYFDNILVTGS